MWQDDFSRNVQNLHWRVLAYHYEKLWSYWAFSGWKDDLRCRTQEFPAVEGFDGHLLAYPCENLDTISNLLACKN